jgi:imidazolonepropionase-like amidohydrolase
MAFVNQRFEKEIGRWQQQGARLLFGTDTAVGGFGWSHPPGFAGYWEMKAWARGGVPLDAIFRAATLENAKAFGLENEVGSVGTGRRANLLLLSKNPLEDLTAYEAIEKVILNGKVIDRETLSARR